MSMDAWKECPGHLVRKETPDISSTTNLPLISSRFLYLVQGKVLHRLESEYTKRSNFSTITAQGTPRVKGLVSYNNTTRRSCLAASNPPFTWGLHLQWIACLPRKGTMSTRVRCSRSQHQNARMVGEMPLSCLPYLIL